MKEKKPRRVEQFRKYLSDHEARAIEAAKHSAREDVVRWQAEGNERAAWKTLHDALKDRWDLIPEEIRQAFVKYYFARQVWCGAELAARTAASTYAVRLGPEVSTGRRVRKSTAPAGRKSGYARREEKKDRDADLVRRATKYEHISLSEAIYHLHRVLEEESADTGDRIPSKTTIWRAIHHRWATPKKAIRRRRS